LKLIGPEIFAKVAAGCLERRHRKVVMDLNQA
jgi:hypothetical protein